MLRSSWRAAVRLQHWRWSRYQNQSRASTQKENYTQTAPVQRITQIRASSEGALAIPGWSPGGRRGGFCRLVTGWACSWNWGRRLELWPRTERADGFRNTPVTLGWQSITQQHTKHLHPWAASCWGQSRLNNKRPFQLLFMFHLKVSLL